VGGVGGGGEEKGREKETIGTYRGGQLTNETGGQARTICPLPSFPHSYPVPVMAINNKAAGGSAVE